MEKLLKQIFILPVRIYQKAISPLLPPTCRFHPSCSQYVVEAILEWGVLKGIWLGFRRIGRCHPWSEGGLDPVPRNEKNHKN
jgi:hypothetical protein